MKKLITPAFLMVVVILALAELTARVFFAQDISGRFAYGYDPQAGFAEKKDGTVKLFRAGGRRFHPQSFQGQRPPDTYRIFVVGDSVPRGPSFKAAYPWLLGVELQQQQPLRVESINLALPGYGARRCQVVLQKALEFEPSLIIMHVNDTNKWEDEREWRRSQEFKGWHPSHWLMKVFIFRRLYEAKLEKVFWPLVPDQIRLKHAVSDADAQVAASKDPEEIAARIRLARETMVENVALVRRHIPLLLISQCRMEKDDGQPPHLTDHGLDAMCAALTGPGVYHLSMREVFNGPDFALYFADSGHLKSQGHQLLAEAISRKIMGARANFGLPGVKVAAAGEAPGPKAPVPVGPGAPASR